MTPIIAGTISGILVVILWILGFISYINKRREERAFDEEVAAGIRDPKQLAEYQMPPDPAVLAGDHEGGERIRMVKQKKRFHTTSYIPDPACSPLEKVTSTAQASPVELIP